jgi:hypothetical protein
MVSSQFVGTNHKGQNIGIKTGTLEAEIPEH